jgi:cell division protein FtsB
MFSKGHFACHNKKMNPLQHPIKLSILAFVAALVGLAFDGTVLTIWNMKREKTRLEKKYQETAMANAVLRGRIEQAANNESFIARQAREKFDFVHDDEMVFIFEGADSNDALDKGFHLTPGAVR